MAGVTDRKADVGDLAGGPGPAVRVDVSVVADRWLAMCPEAVTLAEEAARAALRGARSTWSRAAVLGVILTDDAEQQALNRTYRGKDSSTNVLSFPLADAAEEPVIAGIPLLLGDVFLACETVAREAAEQGKPIADHLRHLVVHGVLHLLGYDHENDVDAAAMEALETEILRGLGVPDPYDEII